MDDAQRRGIQTLLIGMDALPLRGWDYSIAFHRLYEELAMRFRVPLVPFLLVNVMSNPALMQSDRAHPNRDGARAIAELIGQVSRRCSRRPCSGARALRPPADREEQSALVPERANPAQLSQPALGPPVVGRAREQLARLIPEHGARARPQVLNAILRKPVLHLRERVAVLFRMLILIAEPRRPPSRLAVAITQHGSKGIRRRPESRQRDAAAAAARARTRCRRRG